MSAINEPGAWEDANGIGADANNPTREQRLRVVLKGGSGPLSGLRWVAHSKIVVSNVATYTFYSDVAKTVLIATGVLTYSDDTLCDLTGSVWTYP